ncbi:MAG: ribonuclease P protein component [Candidatus Dormibacteria bacterium]
MKRKYRLRRSADFQAVRDERKGAGNDVLRVQVKSNAAGHPRIGIVVTKRLGGAVVRNRVRRQLQAAARESVISLAAFDVVVRPRQAAVSVSAGALRASLAQALLASGAQQ